MPRQNRVNPFGEIIAVSDRGLFMGNRGGCMHTADGQLASRRWCSKRWITCVLEFKDRRRTLMSPGQYTELFFLDEATALSAGHRPCCECRRDSYLAFVAAWLTGNPDARPNGKLKVASLDNRLHEDRVRRDKSKVMHRALVETLPDGAFIAFDAEPDDAWLIWQRAMYRWTPGGYVQRRDLAEGGLVNVLTPLSIVNALDAGYVPYVHSSASASSIESEDLHGSTS